jgi:hypothetical protein
MLDQGRGQRRHHEHAASGTGGSDPQGGIAPPREPSADDRQCRHVGACRPQSDADAIGQVADRYLVNERAYDEASTEQRGAAAHDDPWPEAVAQMARQRTEGVECHAGDREESRRCRPTRLELRRNRFEEYAETVDDAEDDEASGKGRRDRQPCARRIGGKRIHLVLRPKRHAQA